MAFGREFPRRSGNPSSGVHTHTHTRLVMRQTAAATCTAGLGRGGADCKSIAVRTNDATVVPPGGLVMGSSVQFKPR